MLAKLAKKHKVMVAINSDAHTCYGVGECNAAIALAAEVAIEEQYILNSSQKIVREFLARHRTECCTGLVLEKIAL